MSYLVSLALGPVQDFIAAALRTRDLWFGSHLLSEVSKAAARALHEHGATLIFPAIVDPDDLAPDSPLNVANRVVASLDGDERRARTALDAAGQNARARLQEFAVAARKAAGITLREAQWRMQIEDLLELYAAWAPLGADYKGGRILLDRLQAARKATRDFIQPTLQADGPGFGLPKSSLDGRRETVLPESIDDPTRRRLRLGAGEQLDAPGLIKRLAGGRAERFTSVVRIALDPWLRGLDAEALHKLCAHYEPLVGQGLATRVRGNEGRYAAFPFDGDLLYPDRLERALREGDAGDTLRSLRQLLRSLWRRHGEPGSYYALLLADGDRMGALLDQAPGARAHRAISRVLDGFARAVPSLVRDWRGHCVYAGGDDVLALLPLDQALGCAQALQCRFRQSLQPQAEALGLDTAPTLSVGLALAHRLEPLGRVRGWAKEAERLAKDGTPPRNALAVLACPRAGAPLRWRRRWDSEPLRELGRWAAAFAEGRLPDKLPYELRGIARRLQGASCFEALLAQELTLILSKKRTSGAMQALDPALVEALCARHARCGGDALVQELLLARWLGTHGWTGEDRT